VTLARLHTLPLHSTILFRAGSGCRAGRADCCRAFAWFCRDGRRLTEWRGLTCVRRGDFFCQRCWRTTGSLRTAHHTSCCRDSTFGPVHRLFAAFMPSFTEGKELCSLVCVLCWAWMAGMVAKRLPRHAAWRLPSRPVAQRTFPHHYHPVTVAQTHRLWAYSGTCYAVLILARFGLRRVFFFFFFFLRACRRAAAARLPARGDARRRAGALPRAAQAPACATLLRACHHHAAPRATSRLPLQRCHLSCILRLYRHRALPFTTSPPCPSWTVRGDGFPRIVGLDGCL